MGGWLSKLKKAVSVATAIAPVLPVSDKTKTAIADAGRIEQDVEQLVTDVKTPPKPQ